MQTAIMAKHIELSGRLSQSQVLETYSYCKKHFNDDLQIHPQPRSFGMEIDAAVSAISGTVAAVVAIIALCYQITQHRKSSEWTMSKLGEEVSTECARIGLPEIQIAAIDNFEALLHASTQPCKLLLKTPDGIELQMYVFNDGAKFTLQIT